MKKNNNSYALQSYFFYSDNLILCGFISILISMFIPILRINNYLFIIRLVFLLLILLLLIYFMHSIPIVCSPQKWVTNWYPITGKPSGNYCCLCSATRENTSHIRKPKLYVYYLPIY